MLKIDRKDGQQIFIEGPGGDIITILAIKSTPLITRIGIDAPSIYTIMREELVMSLHEIQQTTNLSRQDAERYKEVLDHYQYRTGCSSIDLKECHRDILAYTRTRPGVSLIAAAFVCLARKQGTIIRR